MSKNWIGAVEIFMMFLWDHLATMTWTPSLFEKNRNFPHTAYNLLSKNGILSFIRNYLVSKFIENPEEKKQPDLISKLPRLHHTCLPQSISFQIFTTCYKLINLADKINTLYVPFLRSFRVADKNSSICIDFSRRKFVKSNFYY